MSGSTLNAGGSSHQNRSFYGLLQLPRNTQASLKPTRSSKYRDMMLAAMNDQGGDLGPDHASLPRILSR